MPAQWRLLTEFLLRARGDVRLSWEELDTIVGGLPASAVNHYPQWWHGDRPNTRSWRAAGYEASQVDPGVSVLFVSRGSPLVTRTPEPDAFDHAEHTRHVTASDGAAGVLSALDPDRTLIVIPCAASKRRGGRPTAPSPAPANLAPARRSVLARPDSHTDESLVMPAFKRYEGSLYRACGPVLADLAASSRLLIISGGYGVLKGADLIGYYDRLMRTSDWPRGLLEQVLADYAAKSALDVVAFVGASTDYAKVIRRTPWQLPHGRSAHLVSLRGVRGVGKISSSLGLSLRCFVERHGGYPLGLIVERLPH